MGDRLCQAVVLLLSSAPARYRDGLDNATLLGLGRWAAFEIIDVVQLFPYGRRSGAARAGAAVQRRGENRPARPPAAAPRPRRANCLPPLPWFSHSYDGWQPGKLTAKPC